MLRVFIAETCHMIRSIRYSYRYRSCFLCSPMWATATGNKYFVRGNEVAVPAQQNTGGHAEQSSRISTDHHTMLTLVGMPYTSSGYGTTRVPELCYSRRYYTSAWKYGDICKEILPFPHCRHGGEQAWATRGMSSRA